MASSKKARERKAAKLLSKKRRRKPDETRKLKPLQEKLEKEGLLPDGATLLTNPEGEVRMSDVIEEYMEPWRPMAHNLDELKNLLGLVVLAWNASFFSEEKQDEMLEQLINSQGLIQKGREEFSKFFREMIARKQEYFADNPRKIVEFDVKEQGEDFYFSVASTLD